MVNILTKLFLILVIINYQLTKIILMKAFIYIALKNIKNKIIITFRICIQRNP